MPKARKVDILSTGVISDDALVSLVREYIENEVSATPYRYEKLRIARMKSLSEAYGRLLAGKTLGFFTYAQVNEKLKGVSSKELRYICSLIVYALEKGIISDNKLNRLLTFKHRFTTQGICYADFEYLMEAENYDIFVKRADATNTRWYAKVFFFRCNDLKIENQEAKQLTTEWLDKIKLIGGSMGTRGQEMLEIRRISEELFKDGGIDDLKKEDLICTNQISLILQYLQYINSKHSLPSEIQYILQFKAFYGGKGALKFKEMCLCENVYQYLAIDIKDKNYKAIYKTDVPFGTTLYNDLRGYLQQSPYHDAMYTAFVGELYGSMGSFAVDDTAKLSFDTLTESNRYFFKKYSGKECAQYLFSFYNFCYNKYEINFFNDAGLDIAVLSKRGFLQLVNGGFTVIKYNPNDPVPAEDKWLLCYKREYEASTTHPTSNTITVDFSDIKNETFKAWLKTYVWQGRKSIISKRNVAASITEALNYINSIRTKEILTLFCRDIAAIDSPITQNEAMAVRQYIKTQTDTSPVTQNTKIYNLRAFLQFLDENGVCQIDSGVYYHLYNQNEFNNTAKAIPDDDLRSLTRVMINNAQGSLKNELYSVIFKIALDTEFRISQIVSLQKDCVYETAKKGEYIILSRRKDSAFEDEQQPITIETKRQIDRVITITAEIRAQAPEYLKDMLFIVPQKGTVPVRAITRENFRKYLAWCCGQAEIPVYTANNLRDTHMTKAREFKIKHQLSDIETAALTGHKTPDVDMQHYVDMNVYTMMEALHGVIIGNVNINGNIEKTLPDDIARNENEVSDGCGYCKSPVCNNMTYLDCIMCGDFVTMPSRLPFFEEQVKQMDIKIQQANTSHDKEDYVNIKRLLVAYISRIKSIEKEEAQCGTTEA